MKKFGLIVLVMIFTLGATFAQERGGGQRPSRTMEQGRPGGQGRPNMNPEEMVKRQTQRLVEELKLTKDQEAKVLAINKKCMEKRPFDWSKMRDASEDERTKMREEMKKVQDERNKEIKAVLTPDQIKLYDENLKKREEAMRNRQGGFGGRPQ